MQGIPFREAYKMSRSTNCRWTYHGGTTINHTHEGSIGNLCNDRIALKMEKAVGLFPFERKDKAIEKLLKAGIEKADDHSEN